MKNIKLNNDDLALMFRVLRDYKNSRFGITGFGDINNDIDNLIDELKTQSEGK